MIMVLAVSIAIGFVATLALAPAGSLLMIVLVPIAASIAAMLAGFVLAYRRISIEAPAPSSPSYVVAEMAVSEGRAPQPVSAA